jgi:UDP-3-O-[3-hydroxymyristoyl] glucosamine N-acyltransferase
LRTQEIAELLGGTLIGDPELLITGVARIDEAAPGTITFLSNPRYQKHIATTRASAVLIAPDVLAEGITRIVVKDPRRAFARLLTLFYPQETPPPEGIHPTAVVGEDVTLGERVRIGAHTIIGAGCRIAADVTLYPNITIGAQVTIGEKSVIHSGVRIRHGVTIGKRVVIQDNAVIGSDGFGFAPDEAGEYEKIPQVGTVVIEDDVEIGACCTVDRATLGETRIETGAKLDNLIQVAHNVVIGANTVIAAQTGISGSTKIGKNCMIGGQVGFVGHIALGDGSQVGAQSGVSKSHPAGSRIFGYPARNLQDELKIQASLKNLPELMRTVQHLQRIVQELATKKHGE